MSNRLWWEKYIGDYTFYFGLFQKRDFRIGVTLGNRESCVDLLFFTFGFMK
jgi:hypothetical protein